MEKRRGLSLAQLAEMLAHARLLTPAEVEQAQERWRSESPTPENLEAFSSWLIANQFATEFQLAMLRSGHPERLHLGPYRLLERIGRGRLAMVYKAVHRLGSQVAIKVLPPSRAREPQMVARFQQEARLAQTLFHPNVVRILEVGEDHGLHYLVMEYLEGESLHEALQRRGSLRVEEAVDVIYQALLGLQHLHEQGLVHRNLEPANLMLVQPPELLRWEEGWAGPVVKIIDLTFSSLAVVPSAAEALVPCPLTGETLPLSNAGYLAPEQQRDPTIPDIRSDIYSLGCILFHALTGKPPTERGRQVRENISAGSFSLRAAHPEVPESLEKIVQWMTAQDPARRYQTPERAVGALRTLLVRNDASASSEAERMAPTASPLPAVVEVSVLPAAPIVPSSSAAPVSPSTDWEEITAPAPEPPNPMEGFAEPPGEEAQPGENSGFIPLTQAEASNSAGIVAETLPELPEAAMSSAPRRRKPRLSRRDWILLLAGAAGLWLAQGVGWVLGKFWRN